MRSVFVCAALTALTAAVPTAAVAAENGSVLMFVRDGSRDLELMLTEEVGVMRSMLADAGYRVDVATSDGKARSADSVTLTPTVRLEDVDLSRYVGVVLPCMAPAADSPMPDVVNTLTRRAVERGLPIAASRGSVVTLARAGGIEGRRYAFASAVDIGERPEFLGGKYEGIGVVRDGTISTAGICPLAARSLGEADGTHDLMINFIASLDERS